ncbi:MAG: GNAT family N-acetyltransferase [bacterium]|nr:GNAT family N-acetyltransferase [bacterium]
MESREGFENSTKPVEESPEQKNARFVNGELTEEEIKKHWKNPKEFLFEHEIVKEREGQERKTNFRVRALSEGFKDDLLESIKDSWDEPTYLSLVKTLDVFFEQRKTEEPALLNTEYYIATDTEDRPFAIIGIYTIDIKGGAGFATSEQLNLEEHYLTTRLDWFAVGKEYQGGGIGDFLLGWIEKMAKSRGVRIMSVETDNYANEEFAIRLYEKKGYKNGLDIEDYFGPGRDSVNYYSKVEDGTEAFIPKEKISEDNKQDLLDLGKKIYSPERQKEFEVCLDLLLKQKEDIEGIVDPHSFVLRDENGKIESFSVMMTGVYKNLVSSVWEGSDPDIEGSKSRLASSLRGYAQSQGRGIIILSREGEDEQYFENGFYPANDGVPEVFGKGDSTEFLLYSKKL